MYMQPALKTRIYVRFGLELSMIVSERSKVVARFWTAEGRSWWEHENMAPEYVTRTDACCVTLRFGSSTRDVALDEDSIALSR